MLRANLTSLSLVISVFLWLARDELQLSSCASDLLVWLEQKSKGEEHVDVSAGHRDIRTSWSPLLVAQETVDKHSPAVVR